MLNLSFTKMPVTSLQMDHFHPDFASCCLEIWQLFASIRRRIGIVGWRIQIVVRWAVNSPSVLYVSGTVGL